jgi:hypothetical protein
MFSLGAVNNVLFCCFYGVHTHRLGVFQNPPYTQLSQLFLLKQSSLVRKYRNLFPVSDNEHKPNDNGCCGISYFT